MSRHNSQFDGDEADDNEHHTDKPSFAFGELLDALTERRGETRVSALKQLAEMLRSDVHTEMLAESRETVCHLLSGCLRKGAKNNPSEAAAAVILWALICVTLQGEEPDSEETYQSLRDLVCDTLRNEASSAKVRRACADAIAFATFIVGDMEEDTPEVSSMFESIFSNPKSPPDLICCALNGWALLTSSLDDSSLETILETELITFSALLEHGDVGVRCAAGQCVALLFGSLIDTSEEAEISRTRNDRHGEYFDAELVDTLEALSKQHRKSQSRKDQKDQRAVFRDVLATVEEAEIPEVKIHTDGCCHRLEGWAAKVRQESFRTILQGGFAAHLASNHLVQDIFEVPHDLQHSTTQNLTREELRAHKREVMFASEVRSRSAKQHKRKGRDKKIRGLVSDDW